MFDETIRSVLDQSYSNLEVIIVDDCSQDGSFELAKFYESKDERLRVERNPHNLGPGFSRLHGINCSSGEYIAFIDSDDLWLNSKLEKQLKFMLASNAEFSYTGFRRFLSSTNKLGRYIKPPVSISYKALFSNTAIATSTVIIRRNLLIELDSIETSKKYVEDYVLFFSVLSRGALAWGLNEDLMRYRVQKNSFSRNKPKYSMKVWRTYRDIEHIPLFMAIYYFLGYACRGVIKYIRF
ncbi:glycosyltransferase family 2 protein [Polynucleobacter paneuropaeus]|nr:glycosyltransferase family 2 protein [Polynucleobacter paneuropaeus]